MPSLELQGHAIKNQDLLVASGAISLKGSEGMTAVDEDVEAVVRHRVNESGSYQDLCDPLSTFNSRG